MTLYFQSHQISDGSKNVNQCLFKIKYPLSSRFVLFTLVLNVFYKVQVLEF